MRCVLASRVCACVRLLSATKVWFVGQSEAKTCWVNSFSRTGKCYSASSTSSVTPYATEVSERSSLTHQRGGGGSVGESTDAHAEEPLCREDFPVLRIGRNWTRPKRGTLKLRQNSICLVSALGAVTISSTSDRSREAPRGEPWCPYL